MDMSKEPICTYRRERFPEAEAEPNWPVTESSDHLTMISQEIDYPNQFHSLESLFNRASLISLQLEDFRREVLELLNLKLHGSGWSSLPTELLQNILRRMDFEELGRFKVLSKSCKEFVMKDAFKERGETSSSEGLLTAINYCIKNTEIRCIGYDLLKAKWRPLPPLSPTLPGPDADVFRDYLICGHGGLICVNVGKLHRKDELVVVNPLTMQKFALPSLLYTRSPVLVHMLVDSESKSCIVIVAGSSTPGDEQLSRKVEVLDTGTMSEWKEAYDVPGLIDEHQAGVCVNGILYVIAHLESPNFCRGVVAFDVKNLKWLESLTWEIPYTQCRSRLVNVNGEFTISYSFLQLVETGGIVYLFCQQAGVDDGSVEHCIDELETFTDPHTGAVKCRLRNVVQVRKSDARPHEVYPEHTCVPFGDGKLCIFNTLTRDGVVYDMQDGQQLEALRPPPSHLRGRNFFSLNPASFTLEPDFGSNPIPFNQRR